MMKLQIAATVFTIFGIIVSFAALRGIDLIGGGVVISSDEIEAIARADRDQIEGFLDGELKNRAELESLTSSGFLVSGCLFSIVTSLLSFSVSKGGIGGRKK